MKIASCHNGTGATSTSSHKNRFSQFRSKRYHSSPEPIPKRSRASFDHIDLNVPVNSPAASDDECFFSDDEAVLHRTHNTGKVRKHSSSHTVKPRRDSSATVNHLKTMLPTIPRTTDVSPLELLQKVIDYIFDLQNQLDKRSDDVGELPEVFDDDDDMENTGVNVTGDKANNDNAVQQTSSDGTGVDSANLSLLIQSSMLIGNSSGHNNNSNSFLSFATQC